MTPRVLIADDSLTVRMDLEEAFGAAGFEVASCASLAEARQRVAGEPLDLVLLDLLFPDGSGIDLLAELRRSPPPSAPFIILLSSEAAVRDRVRGLQAGADDYAGKPYDRTYLVARAKELVARRYPASRLRTAPLLFVVLEDPRIRDELVGTFEAGGYQVSWAVGEDATRQAAQLRPDGIVIGGPRPQAEAVVLIQQIRSDPALRATPCVLWTISTDRETELTALAAGADACIPVHEGMAVLLARVTRLVRPQAGPVPETPVSLYGPKRILAVDDSPTYLHCLAEELARDGYDVVLAQSGEEALDLLAVQSVDGILLDVVMPGLSGDETCRRIKQSPAWRQVPVLLLTAHEGLESMLKGMDAGADDYVSKRVEFDVLRARLRAQLRRTQYERENLRMREELLRKEMDARAKQAAWELAEMRGSLLAQLEAKNQELERKNQELQEFAYIASHDLQAPLRAIGSFTQLLAQRYQGRLDAEADEFIRFITDGVRRMQELIEALLHYSRVARAPVRREPLDLGEPVRQALENLRLPIEESGAKVSVDPLPTVPADPVQMLQLFQNLIGNALKFHGSQPSEVHVGAQREGDQWRFEVRDNGLGIDPQHFQSIFRIFKRLQRGPEYPGSGIGLAVCKKVVERHGGRIWVESQPGQGSRFIFTIPATSPVGEGSVP